MLHLRRKCSSQPDRMNSVDQSLIFRYFDNMEAYLQKCDAGFVERSSPRRFCKQMAMYYDLLSRGTDEVAIDIESNWGGEKRMMVTLALTNVLARQVLMRVVPYMESKGLRLERTHLDLVMTSNSADVENERDSGAVTMLRMLVSPDRELSNAKWMEFESDVIEELTEELPPVAKWLDERVLSLMETKGLSPLDAEITIAMLDLVHAVNAPQDQYGFSRSNVKSVLSRSQMTEIVDLFKRRFDPKTEYPEQDDAVLFKRAEEIKASIDDQVEIEIQKRALNKMVDFVMATKRTNAFVPDRFAFAIRIDPSVCVNPLDQLRT